MTVKNVILRSQLVLLSALFCFSSALAADGTSQKKEKQKNDSISAASQKNVAATVNGEPIYAAELQRAKKTFMATRPNVKLTAEQEKEFDDQALQQLISVELLRQGGQSLPIKDIDKQIDDKINEAKKRFPTEADFHKQIATLDMTEDDLREYTRRDIIISNFVQQNFEAKVSVSDKECKKFYDENTDKFQQQESVRASHILIGVDAKAKDSDKKKALEKANTVKRALSDGADFAEQAKKFSTCPSKQQGGDLGYFGKGQMVPEFEQVAFAMKPGETSDIVETQFGYHIIKVIAKNPESTMTYEDVKAQISDHLKGQKISEAISAYLDNARKTGKIDILLK